MEELGIFIPFLLMFVLFYSLYMNGLFQIKCTRAIKHIDELSYY